MQGAIQRRWLSLLVMAFLLVGWQLLNPSPVKKRQNIPKAPEEAIEPLKRAYAAWKQGHYEQAIQIAKAIYERYGEVYAVWWPTWARRIYGQLPDPEDVESVAERGLYLVLRGTTPGQILGFACYEAGRYEEAIAWGEGDRELGNSLVGRARNEAEGEGSGDAAQTHMASFAFAFS
jgi:tetratricopeptide (TPR) repeat protein